MNNSLPYGIDISRYQYSADGKQKPNFTIINRMCSFVAVRAGISWSYIDPWFNYSWANIVKPKIAYHVMYPNDPANRQMDNFLNIVDPKENERLCLDLELDHGASKAKITQTLLNCLNILYDATGRYPIIYSRSEWVNRCLNVSALPENLDWWLAQYSKQNPNPQFTPERPAPPSLPNGVKNWLIHQNGDKGDGKANGVASHYVDQNRWNGTEEDIDIYFGLKKPHEVHLPLIIGPTATYIGSYELPFRPRVRTAPNGSIVRRFMNGEEVHILEQNGFWARIQDGWIHSSWIAKKKA